MTTPHDNPSPDGLDSTPPIEYLRMLRDAREALAAAKDRRDLVKQDNDARVAPYDAVLKQAAEDVAALENTVRDAVLDLDAVDPENAKTIPGVTIIDSTVTVVDAEAAKAHAVKFGMLNLLKLDEAAAKKLAQAIPMPWATTTKRRAVRIATDLSKSLPEVADVDAQ